jgi:hypothetical protein
VRGESDKSGNNIRKQYTHDQKHMTHTVTAC